MARTRRPRQQQRVREKPATGYAPQEGEQSLNGVLFDSDVIIEILRGERRVVDAAVQLERSGARTYCTAIAWAEVYAGLRRGEEQLTEEFFLARGEAVIDARAGRRAGAYLLTFARSHGLELADALVAASATTSGLRLWTLDRRHYPMPDLRFWEPPKT